jgi:hypothetical protein
MDSEVIKEVVPLPEPLVAVYLIALQDLYESLRLWVLIREDPVGLSVWHMLLDLDCVKVKSLS